MDVTLMAHQIHEKFCLFAREIHIHNGKEEEFFNPNDAQSSLYFVGSLISLLVILLNIFY